MATRSKNQPHEMDQDAFFIIAYIIPLLTGIIVLLLKGNESQRLKLHSMQAILIGVVFVILWVLGFIPFIGFLLWIIGFLLWLYGLYVGLKAYGGTDINMPVITDYAKQFSGYKKGK